MQAMPPNHGLGVGGRGIMDVARVVFLAVLFSGIWSGIAWASPRYEGRVESDALNGSPDNGSICSLILDRSHSVKICQ